jgi:serine/threonine protein kinase
MGIDGGHKPPTSLPSSWYRMSGGYADTYIHFKSKQVFKFCHKYFTEEESHKSGTTGLSIIHYSTVCDLVFSKVLMGLQGFPRLLSYDIGDSKIRIEMDYLGKTLYDACQTYSRQTRWALAPKLLDYLIRTNFNLWYNGIQHTDIKPGNILIDSQDNFHLIDFNCMSVRMVQHWSPAIGTWHYVAPEILMAGESMDNSMVWSIGMVMAHWLIGEYPISNERMKRYIEMVANTQQDWRRLMNAIRKKYPEVLQLEQTFTTALGDWWPKLHPLLRWKPYKRWNLERLFQMNVPAHTKPQIHVRNLAFPANPIRVPEYIRERILIKAMRFLQSIHMECFLVNTMSLFDRSFPLMADAESEAKADAESEAKADAETEAISPDLWFVCCWAIQGYLTNDFLFDKDNLVFAVHSHFHLTCDVVMNHIYHVLKACDSQAWQKEWYLYLPPSIPLTEIQWERVGELLGSMKDLYTPESVANAYAKLS